MLVTPCLSLETSSGSRKMIPGGHFSGVFRLIQDPDAAVECGNLQTVSVWGRRGGGKGEGAVEYEMPSGHKITTQSSHRICSYEMKGKMKCASQRCD